MKIAFLYILNRIVEKNIVKEKENLLSLKSNMQINILSSTIRYLCLVTFYWHVFLSFFFLFSIATSHNNKSSNVSNILDYWPNCVCFTRVPHFGRGYRRRRVAIDKLCDFLSSRITSARLSSLFFLRSLSRGRDEDNDRKLLVIQDHDLENPK